MKKSPLFFVAAIIFDFLICTENTLSQSHVVDSLIKVLTTTSGKEKILLQTSIADKLPSAKVDSAIWFCYQGLKLAKEMKGDSLQATCYRCLISAYYNKPYFEDSALYFIPFFKKHVEGKSFYELEYAGYLAIADVYLKKHEYSEATVYYQLAMQMAEKTKRPGIVGWAKYKLAEMYRKSENFTDAIKLCFELVAEGKKYNLPANTFNGYRGIAICFDMQHQYDSAEIYFSLALETAKETKQKNRIATAQSLLGLVQWHLKKYTDAVASMHQAKEFYQTLDNEQIIPVLQNLCCVYNDMDKLDSAEIYCKMGLEKATKRNQQLSISQLNGFLSEVYKKKGDYKSAWDHLTIRRKFEDSLHTADRVKTVMDLEEKYKNKENQSRINLLSKDNELKQLLIKKRETDLLNAACDAEQQKKLADLNTIEIKNKKTELQLANSQSQLKEKEKAEAVNLLNIQNINYAKQKKLTYIIASLILLLTGIGFLSFRQRQKLKARLEQQQAIINERQRISRDLHDDLGAQLSTAKMFLSSIKNNPDLSNNNVMLETSLNLIDTTIGDLKKIMDDLQSSVLQDKGYIAATEELVSKINQLQQINFSLTHYNSEKRLDRKTEHNLFRITQELINNSLKYARAKNVSINLVKHESKIVLMYEDDGTGFNMAEVRKGNGLLNIEARCNAVGGKVEFDSEPGAGARTIIEMPLAYAS